MNETQVQPQPNQPLTREQTLQNIEQVRDLFARSHDLIAQSNHPGHLGQKIAEALNFLAFQYNDFKLRAETLAKQIKSEVDVKAAEAAVAETLAPEAAAVVAPVAEGPVA